MYEVNRTVGVTGPELIKNARMRNKVASQKQIDMLSYLCNAVNNSMRPIGQHARVLDYKLFIEKKQKNNQSINMLEASIWITELNKIKIQLMANETQQSNPFQERKAQLTTPVELPEAGIYVCEHNFYKVSIVRGRKVIRKLKVTRRPDGVAVLVKWQRFNWSEVRQIVPNLTPAPLSIVTEFGRTTGFCGCCGKTLTDPESVRLGIGPICQKRYFRR